MTLQRNIDARPGAHQRARERALRDRVLGASNTLQMVGASNTLQIIGASNTLQIIGASNTRRASAERASPASATCLTPARRPAHRAGRRARVSPRLRRSRPATHRPEQLPKT